MLFCLRRKKLLYSIQSGSKVAHYIEIVQNSEEVHDYSQSAKIRARGVPRVLRREGYKKLLHRGSYTIFSTTRYVKTLSDNNY
jgi:hypothetical protein